MSVTKNYIYNTILQITNILVPFITVPYISRVLGPNGVGIVSFTGSIVQYFILFGTLGLTLYGNRAIAYVRDNPVERSKVFWELFFFKLITIGLAISAYIIFIFAFNPEYTNIYLIQGLSLLGAAVDITWLFMGLEDFKKTVLRSLFVKLIGVIVIFSFVRESSDVGMYALASAGSNFVGQLVIWGYVPKYVNYVKVSLKNIFSHFRGTVKLFIPMVAVQVYVVLDKTMIGLITNETEVGIYEMSQRLVKMALSLVTSMGIVMIPKMSSIVAKKDETMFNEYAKKSFDFASYSSIFIAFMLVGITPEFVPLFFGNEFIKTITVIRAIVPIVIFIAWSNVLGMQIMVPTKHEKWLTMSVTAGALVNFPLNLLLIPSMSSIGAAISSAIAEFSVTFVQLLLIRKILSVSQLFYGVWKHFVSGLFAFAVTRAIAYLDISVISIIMLQIIVGTITYISIESILHSEMNTFVLMKAKAIIEKLIKGKRV